MKKLYILSVALFVFSLGLSAQSTPDNWTVATSLITVSEETTTVSEGAKAMKVVFTGTANEDIVLSRSPLQEEQVLCILSTCTTMMLPAG